MKSERVLPADVKSDLDRLTAEFFRVVSFRRGEKPPHSALHNLFVDNGLLIKNSLSTPEISPPNAVCLDSMLRRWHAVRSAPVSFVRWAAGDDVT